MQAPHPSPPPLPLQARPRVWTDAARALSAVCNPFFTSLALFVVLAGARSHGRSDFWMLLFNSMFFTLIAPMLYIGALYKTGRISDLDMSNREERKKVMGGFVVFFALGTLDLALIHAPVIMIAAMAAFTASSLIVQWITVFWKISGHAVGITAPIVALMYLFGREPMPILVLIPMVGWARIYLKAHTVLQVVAGTTLGALSTVLFFALFHVA